MGVYIRNRKPKGVDRHNDPWTADDDAHLLRLRSLGHTFKVIGLYIGRTPQSARLRARSLRLEGAR